MAKPIDPLISSSWLATRLADAEPLDLMIVDIREGRLYEAGHIPGSVSIPFSPMSVWAVSDDELLMELPPAGDLSEVLTTWGISPETAIVLVGTVEPAPAPPYALADAPRVAATLSYMDVQNVGILDGGYPKWHAEGRASTGEVPVRAATPTSDADPADDRAARRSGAGAAAARKSVAAPAVFVSTEYVKESAGRAVLIDGRDTDQYFGVTPCPFAGVGGHIPQARSLPAPWIWNSDGTYKSVELLEAMAEGVVGADRDQEIIAYCGVGGYASTWWFVLTRILGYRDVKIYDGSAEAWAKSEPMTSYSW
jgi:thiosulfate/3-mercaptopyruvate sulfurtransferase